MSKYSGKADCGDTYEILGEEKFFKTRVYFGDNIVPLKIETYKDALPYFPYLEKMATGDSIWLCTESYVDTEERETLAWKFSLIKKFHRKCKRNKTEFSLERFRDEYGWFVNDSYIERMFEEVGHFGQKAEVPEDCHTKMAEIYREHLFEDMIKAGYTEFEAAKWVYGWKRAWDMSKAKESNHG